MSGSRPWSAARSSRGRREVVAFRAVGKDNSPGARALHPESINTLVQKAVTRHRCLATIGTYVRVQQAWTDNAATVLGL